MAKPSPMKAPITSPSLAVRTSRGASPMRRMKPHSLAASSVKGAMKPGRPVGAPVLAEELGVDAEHRGVDGHRERERRRDRAPDRSRHDQAQGLPLPPVDVPEPPPPRGAAQPAQQSRDREPLGVEPDRGVEERPDLEDADPGEPQVDPEAEVVGLDEDERLAPPGDVQSLGLTAAGVPRIGDGHGVRQLAAHAALPSASVDRMLAIMSAMSSAAAFICGGGP